jgi:hypothetical protein
MCNCFPISFKPTRIGLFRMNFEPRLKEDDRKRRH